MIRMGDEASELYLLLGSFGLALTTLLFHTVFSSLMSPTLKTLSIVSSILLIMSTAICLLTKPITVKIEGKAPILPSILLFFLYVLALAIELRSSGARSFSSLVLMVLGMGVACPGATSSDRPGVAAAMNFAFVATFLASAYALFPPSLGNDAWRDIMYSLEILRDGHIPRQTQAAYPIPLVSLTYSVYSLVTSVDARWATAITGLDYLLVASLSMLLIARGLAKPRDAASSNALSGMPLFTSLFVILNPLIVTWCLEPVPQAYATALMLIILLLITFQKSSPSAYTATLPLSLALVLVHGGVTLWFIAFLSAWLLMSSPSKAPRGEAVSLAGKVLKAVAVIALAYWTYTTVIEVVVWGSRDTVRLLINLMSGGATQVSGSAEAIAPAPWYTVVLAYFALSASLVFAFVGWSLRKEVAHPRDDAISATFLSGVASAFLVFIGNNFNPDLGLERYAGLSAFVVLALPASVGLHALRTRGRAGKIFVGLVVITMASGLAFGGFYTPDCAPLGQTAWLSQRAPPTYSEETCLERLSLMIEEGSMLTDWRAGLVLCHYYYINMVSKGRGFGSPSLGGLRY